MPWLDYRRIRQEVRLEAILNAIGWQATKACGVQLRGPCPLAGCKGTSTFSVEQARNIYRCFRCGSSGSVIDFWSSYCKVPIWVAATELNDQHMGRENQRTSNEELAISPPQNQQLPPEPPRVNGSILNRD
jgi:DNA primase